MKKRFTLLVVGCMTLAVQPALGHGPKVPSMIGAPIPPVPGLLDGPDPIVVDKDAAIALGKAAFWDMSIGSDGQACASCHFHAGADRRTKNQLNSGHLGVQPTASTFEETLSGLPGGPNYTLTMGDYPFKMFADPFDITTEVLFMTDDVTGSSGTFGGEFMRVRGTKRMVDECDRGPDPTFHVGAMGTRKVEPRNTPTVINAVFNHRNFWDGRANNVFNGSSPWGDRDPDAGVWVKINKRTVEKQKLALPNSSLASQAVAPPLNDFEMACSGRSFAALGRKVLKTQPLRHQQVHWDDSVLGSLSLSTSKKLRRGLNTTYAKLVRKAFNEKYWSSRLRGPFGGPGDRRQRNYNQMEANFALFFGLAIQLYESTLISDQAPIDTSPRGEDFIPTEFSESERRGMELFSTLHCNLCHVGPSATTAAIWTNAEMMSNDAGAFGPPSVNQGLAISFNIVNRDLNTVGSSLNDAGFVNTTVTDPEWDPGLGGVDDFGNPLSFASQYANYLAGDPDAILDKNLSPGIKDVRPCDFQTIFAQDSSGQQDAFFTQVDGVTADPNGSDDCFRPASDAFIPTEAAAASEQANPDTIKMKLIGGGTFKVPTLRNIELTGPYMHNGGFATLDQVFEFYARPGNHNHPDKHGILIAAQLLRLPDSRADLLAFLKTLTDDRVRYERAPFDHPELKVFHGHEGNNSAVVPGNPLDVDLAEEEELLIPAVGQYGLSDPIGGYDQFLAP